MNEETMEILWRYYEYTMKKSVDLGLLSGYFPGGFGIVSEGFFFEITPLKDTENTIKRKKPPLKSGFFCLII